ncbi:MAG: DUF488 family protein [Leptospiraceae bacterium]|nr:DUF488 family protein [Leptospiraceae bacterium]MCK6381304.1 DUF488 family protein [Leptospiraceae bacterium]NUM42951.1 DUF488 family protein [Leptospiraceae bacterium]
MNIHIKRVYAPAEKNDGFRILIDRLWPRGLSKNNTKIDEWLKEIAPSPNLRKWFNHKDELFKEFSKLYTKELKSKSKEIEHIRNLAKSQTVTLLYSAKNKTSNHAIVLKKFLEQMI